MGCFSTCFNTCNPSRRRRRRRSLKPHPSLLDHLQNYQSIDDFKVPLQLIREEEENDGEIEEKEERQGEDEGGDEIIELSPDTANDEKSEKANSSGRKKVTFDLNVKFYENSTKEGESEEINEEEEEEELDDDYYETEKKEQNSKSSFGCECGGGSDSSSSSLFSYPIKSHRYQNIRDSDDEFDDMASSDESDNDYYTDEDDVNDEDGDDNDEVKSEMGEEQSSESLFSLSIDSRKKKLGTLECEKEVNSPMLLHGLQSDSGSRYDRRNVVLNPVENLTQWKDMKSRSRTVSKNQQTKENLNIVQDFSFPVKNEALENQKEVMAVDTSLSTWLGESGKGRMKRSDSRNSEGSVGNLQSDSTKVSPNKFEDRPILGALTVEEIRQISAGSTPRKSPRKSPSPSPDDVPIIGSVGSYWSHTGQGTDSGGSSRKSTKSRYRESAEIVWDATPFETRLEKALEKEASGEQVIAV